MKKKSIFEESINEVKFLFHHYADYEDAFLFWGIAIFLIPIIFVYKLFKRILNKIL
jgi:hypothetical protein